MRIRLVRSSRACLFSLWLAGSFLPNLANADTNLAALHTALALQFAAMSVSLGNYQNLPCVTPSSLSHLNALQANAVQVQTAFETQYQDYMSFVQKPMQGNGKCDGGFQAVATESEHRRVRSTQMMSQIQNLRNGLSGSLWNEFEGVEIDMPDDSDDAKCAKAASQAYDAVENSGELLLANFTQFQAGVDSVRKRFQSYAKANSNLAGDCGNMPTDFTQGIAVAPLAVKNGKAIPSGQDRASLSSVTGKSDDQGGGGATGASRAGLGGGQRGAGALSAISAGLAGGPAHKAGAAAPSPAAGGNSFNANGSASTSLGGSNQNLNSFGSNLAGKALAGHDHENTGAPHGIDPQELARIGEVAGQGRAPSSSPASLSVARGGASSGALGEAGTMAQAGTIGQANMPGTITLIPESLEGGAANAPLNLSSLSVFDQVHRVLRGNAGFAARK